MKLISSYLKSLIRWLEFTLISTTLFLLYLFRRPSQPLYNLGLLKPERTKDHFIKRADTILQSLQVYGQGGYILDLNCQAGFFSFYFAERGYKVDGLDPKLANLGICKLLQRLNRKKTQFAKLTKTSLHQLEADHYDLILVLGDVKQLLKLEGLSQISELIKLLLEKTSSLLIHLNTQQAEHLKNCLVDSPITMASLASSLFRIQKNTLKVKDQTYSISQTKFLAHDTAGYLSRAYYDCGTSYIKKYRLGNTSNNLMKILQEIANNQKLADNSYFPKLLSHEQRQNSISLVFNKIQGENLQDLLTHKANQLPLLPIIKQIIRALAFLLENGLYHNDLRIWNILIDKEKVHLFDLGLAHKEEKEDTRLSLLWLIAQLQNFEPNNQKWPVTQSPPHLRIDLLSTEMKEVVLNLEKSTNFKDFLMLSSRE